MCPPSNPAQLQLKLQSLKCIDNNFHALSLDIQRLSQEIYANCPPAIRALNVVQAFIHAVPPPIRSHLMLFKFATIHDALDTAEMKLEQLKTDSIVISHAVVGTSLQGMQEQPKEQPQTCTSIQSSPEVTEQKEELTEECVAAMEQLSG